MVDSLPICAGVYAAVAADAFSTTPLETPFPLIVIVSTMIEALSWPLPLSLSWAAGA